MKLILIIILISVIMLISYAVTEQIKDKFDFYSNLKNFLTQFKINISFRQDKILEFLNKTKCKKQFALFIEDYKQYLKTNELSLVNIKILDEEEKTDLIDIVNNLGKHNIENEIGQIEAYLNTIDIKLNKAKDDKDRLCPMIIKLSLLFAVGLAILLI